MLKTMHALIFTLQLCMKQYFMVVYHTKKNVILQSMRLDSFPCDFLNTILVILMIVMFEATMINIDLIRWAKL